MSDTLTWWGCPLRRTAFQLFSMNEMEKRIFDKSYACPCMALHDMEVCGDYYTFLEEMFGDLDHDWKKNTFADLECAYCLLKLAAGSDRTDRCAHLANIKNNVTAAFLEKILELLRFYKDGNGQAFHH